MRTTMCVYEMVTMTASRIAQLQNDTSTVYAYSVTVHQVVALIVSCS
jgi:hypothetical protein